MSFQNKKSTTYFPLALSVILIIGMLLGIQLEKRQVTKMHTLIPKTDKLQGILDFIAAEYVDSVSKSDLEESAIPNILSNLDPHSVYIPARDVARVNEPLRGNFDGIGVSFNMPNDTVVINTVIQGGPSEKVGLLAGDRIVEINDSVVAGRHINQNDIVKQLKGPRGTKVKVGILRKEVPDLINFTITRAKIPLYSVDVSYMMNDSTGYIKISKFARTTNKEFLKAIEKLKNLGMTQMVLDLRLNSGGYMDAATHIANQFLPKNTLIVYTKGKAHPREDFFADGTGKFQKEKLVVLIDEFSASASEILAGAIQDNDRGTIMGRRSFGKGLVQEPLVLSDGSAIRLTIARYYTPTGRCIQKSYSKGTAEYYHDIQERISNGEFEIADSIHFNDSLKFETPGGRIVYGGGGIMPDVFIPMDTTGISPWFIQLRNRGLIYLYALDYTDRNRVPLEQFKTAFSLKENLSKQPIFSNFIRYAKSKGLTPTKTDLKTSGRIVQIQIEAYIARNMLDNDGFYPIWQDIDHTLQEANKFLSKKSS